MKKSKMIFKSFTGILMFAFIALQMQSCEPAVDEIELGYVLWDSEIASTHVVAAIIEDDLGHQVSMRAVDAGPMWMGVARGDFDAIVAAWLPTTHEAYLEQTREQVENLGPNLEGAKIGWVVPEYVPVNSIDELDEHEEEFNSQVIGIDPGAGLMAASDEALEVYDLDYTLVEGSGAAMTAALRRAIERDEWIVVTGWTPHWKFVAFDLKYLEDPENVFGDEEYIATIVHPDLQEKAPDVYTFLDNFHWSTDDMGEVMMMIEDGMEPFEAARQWISENRDMVEGWLPQ